MECFECTRTCPADAFVIDKSRTCVRLGRSAPLRIDDDKCDQCDLCNESCPLGNVALSAEGCSFCVICKSAPSCLLPEGGRVSSLNSIASALQYIMLRCRVTFQ